MTVKFKLRRVSDWADCSLEANDTFINLGFNDRNDAIKLLEDFKAAVDDLEWFIHVTEK